MSDTKAAFLEHARTIGRYADLKLSEADTRSYLIDPMLVILGYEGVEHLRREVPVPATKEFLDYELLIDGEPRAIVEAKAVGRSLSDRHAGQCVQYASVVGVRWSLITNGLTWVVYDAHARGPLAEKRVAEVTLDGDERSVEEAWEVLSLFSREALARSSPISDLLVDRVVADELADPDSAAVKALQRAVRSRFDERVSVGAVVRGIERRASRFAAGEPDVASAAPEAPSEATPEAAASTTAKLRAPRRAAPRGRPKRATLGDLVAAELLPADAALEAVVDGVTHVARLNDGGIELAGVVYPTPSGASQALRQTQSWNGWVDWRFRGETLAQIRSRLPAAQKQEESGAG